MSTTLLIVVVLLIGIALFVLELVALPGGIAGIFGVLLMAFGIWQTYSIYDSHTGTIVLLCAIALCVLLTLLLLRPRMWKRFSLNEESDSTIEPANVSIGNQGTTISRLAPTGKAIIGGQTVEVHAVNKFIDPERTIEVIAIEGYRIDVREIDDQRF